MSGTTPASLSGSSDICTEFMEFVENNGYEREEFWDEEGLKYLKNTNAKYPVFWILKDGVYKYRAISQIIDMPLDWPVDVNALEGPSFL